MNVKNIQDRVVDVVSDLLAILGFIGLGVALALAAGWVGILGYVSVCALVSGLAMAQAKAKPHP
jgi:hypothetical protein